MGLPGIKWGFVPALLALCLNNAWAASSQQRIEILKLSTNDPLKWEMARTIRPEDAPLTIDDVQDMLGVGLDERVLLDIMKRRKVALEDSSQAFDLLRQRGASKRLIRMLPVYSLPKNSQIQLELVLDVELPYIGKDDSHLYIGLINSNNRYQEGILSGSLNEILAQKWLFDEMIQPFGRQKKRRLKIVGPLHTRSNGQMVMNILISKQAGIRDLTNTQGLTVSDRMAIHSIPFEYPTISRLSQCALNIVLGPSKSTRQAVAVKRKQLHCFWE